jgi:hypothetical protein
MADNQQLILPCLGRQMGLGMLYDSRNDNPVAGITLWNFDTLQKFKGEPKRCDNIDSCVMTDDSLETKTQSMNISGELKLSFLVGLFEVSGGAKYLKNKKTSTHQARVVMKYSCETFYEELTMDQLANIEHENAIQRSHATHVVTRVVYGADAFFIFDRQLQSSESSGTIEGAMKATLDKIAKVGPSVEIKGKINDEIESVMSNFTCTYHGDVQPQVVCLNKGFGIGVGLGLGFVVRFIELAYMLYDSFYVLST